MADDTVPAELKKAKSFETWMVYIPNGRAKPTIVLAMPWQSQSEAWDAALFWPSPEEIEDEKRKGAFCVRATVSYEEPNGR